MYLKTENSSVITTFKKSKQNTVIKRQIKRIPTEINYRHNRKISVTVINYLLFCILRW